VYTVSFTLFVEQPYVFYGVANAGHDHASALTTVKGDLEDIDAGSVTLHTGLFTGSLCKTDLLTADVFVSRSHGVALGEGDAQITTGILLNDGHYFETVDVLLGHNDSEVDELNFASYTCLLSTEDYSHVSIALFIGCQTGQGGTDAPNLPARIVELGARAAVGFEKSIDCAGANRWTTDLFEQLLNGKTLEEAVNDIKDRYTEESGLRSAIIFGDGTVRLG
jgi:hypothetical protein